MRYGILGTTQAHSGDGHPLALGGARLRALLAALALHPGRVRTAEALIRDVWEADPPADAPGALQALVGRLRRVLGPGAVDFVAGGYRLCAGPEDVDLHRFRRLADEGAAALAGGDPGKAYDLTGEALALWRGPVLADLPGRAASAPRHEARRLDARRTRLAAAVALGRAAASLPELADLCAEHPLDEPLHALRLRALRAAGRPAEALAAYESLRTALADRLGTDPGPELRALHTELLTPAPLPGEPRRGAASGGHAPPGPVPGGPTPGATPAHRAGGPGDLARGAGAAPAPRLTPAPPPPGNLRARLTSFVGREEELERIRADLGRHRLVTLLGPGGAGKTRLSQEAAEAAAAGPEGPGSGAPAWPDGVWFAELAPLDDPGTVPEAVLTALGGRETVVRGGTAEGVRAATDAADPLARLVEHCAPRRMLLVLDNCEHVVDAAARLTETVLAHCPGVTVLATSREPLAVPGEQVRPVEPLPDPVALRLLADRGAAARPGFRTEDDPEACAEICRRLDGLPLAIELAAARLRMLDPRGLADRLDDRFRLLTSGSRTVLPRQQTLRAVVDWSWDLLDEPERAVLRRLSVFSGGCDLAAAEEVCSDGPGAERAPDDAVGARDVAALLGSLVDKSLVVAEPAAGGGMRYRLLETVGEYAAERLDEAGERAGAERRHLVAYRELARTADPLLRGPAQAGWLERLELEHDNLRTALRRAVAARDEQEALCLVLSLGWFWQLREHRADGAHWAEVVGAMGPDPFAEPVAPVAPLYVTCTERPPPMSPEVLVEARRGVHLTRLVSMTDMGLVHLPETQRRLRAIATAYGDVPPQSCRLPGFIVFFAFLMTGDFEGLYRILDTMAARCRELGYAWELGHVLQLRSKIFNDQPGGLDQATADAEESVRIFRRLGDSWGVAEGLTGLGEVHERRGQFGLAAEDYREAVEQVREIGSTGQLPALRARLAGALVEAGTVGDDEGERMLRDAIAEAKQGNTDAAIFGRLQLGVRVARAGRTAEAREIFEELMADFGIRSVVMFESLMCGQMAWLDTLEGRPADALPRLRKALSMAGDPLSTLAVPQLPMTHLLFAALAHAALAGGELTEPAAREGHALRAARLMGAGDGLRPADFPAASVEREVRERTEAGAREVLGDGAYERAYTEGGGLTLEEATALV
ncbi:AfsR/SARP family transcriptional regulator [Streptomyces albireticuli]|uniref:AfsR family transcriptional regulator n=1 Tax=Streptomyces albireticuli TaxID=1940 RepID=A0A2A2DE69_9ACTN|nr:BTAD domain-containing putative transcriptional regulator [Streptomyces albireticuli]MCD9142013.1 winged helix-turn-helix domain-containing protein [Streptomyces albireticuli]MCD9163043.1 winged helix-turn-helix domain-containing protein [Streptomyces albireticuli]MCD9190187.1 winged helix-turn-helix domain-containing protein [Streptomyces albireticuli]PAU50788.1 AfsR family transcriptional regulator [Streptomyces albireticuli]